MKKTIFLFTAIFCFTLSGYSQDSFTVNGLTEGKQWQIIEKAIYDNGFEVGKFYQDEQILYTNWIQWNSLTIQNRGLIEIKLKGQDVTVSMVKRGYKSTEGWSDAIGKLSKKNKKKFLISLIDRIAEINASGDLTSNSVLNSKLFPVFNPINTIGGIQFTLNSVSQDLNSANKALTISFTLKNNTDIAAKMEINFWGSQDIFLGVPVKMENYNLKGKAGYSKFIKEIKPNETATYSAYYKCSGVISKIPRYNYRGRVNGKAIEFEIHDIILPYYNKSIEVSNNNLTDTNQTENLNQKSPQGIYDNFAILRTGNPEMQLMAIDVNGSMVGYQLTEDLQRIKSVSFRADKNAQDFVLLFDEEGLPKGGGFGDYVYVFQHLKGDTYNAITYDKDKTKINEVQVQLPKSLKVDQNNVLDNNYNKGGPNSEHIYYNFSADIGTKTVLEYSTRIFNGISCAVAIPTGLGAIAPCGYLILDEIIRVLPKDNSFYDELVLARDIISIAESLISPKKILENLAETPLVRDMFITVFGAMLTSIGAIHEMVEEYLQEDTPNKIEPLIAITDKEYEKVDCVDAKPISVVMYINIIVDHKEVTKFNDGRKTENNKPEMEKYFQVNINTKEMCFSNSVFTGLIKNKIGIAMDEVLTYKGKVSKDKKKVEYIEITKESTQYVTGDRKEVEKTISISVRFENIPLNSWGGGFEYKYGITKISSVSYSEKYRIPRYGYINSYTEEFVKIDEEKMPKHYRGVTVSF